MPEHVAPSREGGSGHGQQHIWLGPRQTPAPASAGVELFQENPISCVSCGPGEVGGARMGHLLFPVQLLRRLLNRSRLPSPGWRHAAMREAFMNA